MQMANIKIPTPQQLRWPVLQAIRTLGGSAHISDISEEVARQEGYTEELLLIMHPGTRQTEIDYRLAWARTELKKIGALTNSTRGVWALTPQGRELTQDEAEQKIDWPGSPQSTPASSPDLGEDPDRWREQLLDQLLAMTPAAFEQLAKRLLREAGFRKVEVLGGSGDGGLNGVGIYRLSLVSFPTFFQCKRYRGSVGPDKVRDFRGAMAGRGNKGLMFTTGSFTRSARAEATRDGAPTVDLIGGYELCDLLKEYELGVKVTKRIEEDVEVDPEFFDQF